MSPVNPCLRCGACCAYFRVSFYWAEADSELGGTVPTDMVEDVTPFVRCMAGTNQKSPRCIALQGDIGKEVFCSIYSSRSSSCREFGVQWISNRMLFLKGDYERCTAARINHGLPPLEQHNILHMHHSQRHHATKIRPIRRTRRRRPPRGGIPGAMGGSAGISFPSA